MTLKRWQTLLCLSPSLSPPAPPRTRQFDDCGRLAMTETLAAVENYGNNKDGKIYAPAHDVVGPFLNGTVLRRKLFTGPLLIHCACANGLGQRSRGRLSKFCNASRKDSQLAQEKLLKQPQYCLHNIVCKCISLSGSPNFGQNSYDATSRSRDCETDRYMLGQETTPDAEYWPHLILKLRKVKDRK
jgi:hypothetical protein